jgi:hypothetical protein
MNLTRAQRAARWIEKHCICPDGLSQGRLVLLSLEERAQLREIFDLNRPPPSDLGRLSAFLALLFLCGPEAVGGKPSPALEVDTWTVWRSAGDACRDVLTRQGSHITCPELGTRFPRAA